MIYFILLGKFGIGRLLSRQPLEIQDGVSASELILSLCLFRIVGESIHNICKHKTYELLNYGKNRFYRIMIRTQVDWKRLKNHFALHYMCLLRKYGNVYATMRMASWLSIFTIFLLNNVKVWKIFYKRLCYKSIAQKKTAKATNVGHCIYTCKQWKRTSKDCPENNKYHMTSFLTIIKRWKKKGQM